MPNQHPIHAMTPDHEARCGADAALVYASWKRWRVNCPKCLELLARAERLKTAHPHKE